MDLKVSRPLTVLYRGTLRDTAVLVGLAQSHANVNLIAFTGDVDRQSIEYIDRVNDWLSTTHLPQISIYPQLSRHDLKTVLSCPLRAWGWSDKECEAAVRLVGIPLPCDELQSKSNL